MVVVVNVTDFVKSSAKDLQIQTATAHKKMYLLCPSVWFYYPPLE